MYSNTFTLPDSDDEEEVDKIKNENLKLEVKNDYVKLNEIQEVDNKLEIDKEEVKKEGEENGENKELNKDNEKDKTQDLSNRSLDPLIKEGQEDKKGENKLDNTPTSVSKKIPKKERKVKQKGMKFDTVDKTFNSSLI